MTPKSAIFPFSAVLLAAVVLPVSPLRAADPAPAEVLREMERVADWQLAHPSKHRITDWTQAPFFLGLFNLHQVSGDAKYLDALKKFGDAAHWGPGPRVTHADDHAVLQAWLEIYELDGDKAKLAPAIAQFDKIQKALAGKPPKALAGGTFTWCWCDALFMSPAVWTHLSKITGDAKFLDWSDREWWTTTDILYDPQHCLYYRDNRFFDKRTPTGRKVFWSRGNGWVAGGTVHVLDRLPANHPSRTKYLGLYHDMMHALLKLQNPDGLWRTSLLDPEGPVGESSGTAFFVYAMAWGVNRGLLPAETFRPAVMNGWRALCKNIQPDGMLGFVQKIGDQPGAADAKSTEVYGAGAFLLAGAEIVRMLEPSKRRQGLADFKGATLPPRYLREKPRVVARFVPERKDDFAWENDLVAFRVYGPALRANPEDSGFDCWLKRVPYPILDKWYFEQRTRAPHSNKIKSYHDDQGEGCDGYKVGNTRGCGGISLWADGKLHNSNAFVAHRLLENTPQRAVFELDYQSKLGDKTVRETKHITVLMGQRLFQCESRFTIDGKPGAIDVAIGLKPQTPDTKSFFHPKTGTMALWGKLEGDLGSLGQGIAVDPARITKMITHTDAQGQTQTHCLARTDESGAIRWFAGFAWDGQGEITTADQWNAYLAKFASQYSKKSF
jgi:rhamnogalacturonyl hydrolase YesR